MQGWAHSERSGGSGRLTVAVDVTTLVPVPSALTAISTVFVLQPHELVDFDFLSTSVVTTGHAADTL